MAEPGAVDRAAVERDVAAAAVAHAALLDHVGGLTDAQVRQPSVLPDWTVGHVLAHLARNADSHVRLLRAAQVGEVADQYVGGREGRRAEIDAGASRPAAEHLADLHTTIAALETQWQAMADVGWPGAGRAATGDLVPSADLPFRRWRETVIHHHDLGLPGYTWRDWPAEYVRADLRRLTMQWASRKPMGFADLPAPALAVSDHHRLAWLVGRAEIDGLDPAGLMA